MHHYSLICALSKVANQHFARSRMKLNLSASRPAQTGCDNNEAFLAQELKGRIAIQASNRGAQGVVSDATEHIGTTEDLHLDL